MRVIGVVLPSLLTSRRTVCAMAVALVGVGDRK